MSGAEEGAVPGKTEKEAALLPRKAQPAGQAPSLSPSGHTAELSQQLAQSDSSRPARALCNVRTPFVHVTASALLQWITRHLRAPLAFLRLAALEIDSLGQRIGMIAGTKPHLYGTYLGPSCRTTPTGCLVECAATSGRIRDIQDMLASRPRATVCDQALFLEGWEKGAQWAADTLRIQNQCNESTGALYSLGDLIADLAALRESKRDRLIRLASRKIK